MAAKQRANAHNNRGKGMTEQYDDRGKIALWRNTTGNPNAPVAKGHFYAHRDIKEGEKIDVSLWKESSQNANAPVMKGEIQDKFVKDGFADAPPAEDNEDIPF
tara:strand:+ start:157 stop:465 length:309 start_codon:yes stop_codon:yes gene_type:complete